MVTALQAQNVTQSPVVADQPAIASTNSHFRIPREVLNKAVATCAEAEREALTWLWQYCHARNYGRERISALVRKPDGAFYSYDSIYQALTGRRGDAGASLEPLCRAIESFRRTVESAAPKSGFVETELAGEIWSYVRRARATHKIGFIFGDFSIGKTEAAQELARRDSSVIYERMPTRGQLSHFLQRVARRLAMGERQTLLNLRDRVIDSFDENMVLIVDEADQCFGSIRNSYGLATLDFLRELWDRSGCGLVLMLDHAGRDALRNGIHKERLKRLWRRRLPFLQLESSLSENDLNLFAASFGLPPAPDEQVKVKLEGSDIIHEDNPARLQRDIMKRDGLTVWLGLLNDAQELAREKKRTLVWPAVIKAHALFAAMESEDGK